LSARFDHDIDLRDHVVDSVSDIVLRSVVLVISASRSFLYRDVPQAAGVYPLGVGWSTMDRTRVAAHG
jgi:hypothetical protein